MKPDIKIEKSVEMPMRDGVLLRGDVWRADDDQPRPALLSRTGYDRRVAHSYYLTPIACADAGYAFVMQDSRGRYESDGEWVAVSDPSQETRDTYDTIEWIAAQPWCDGNVGMIGMSAGGVLQWDVAVEQPPHLKAIAPSMASTGEDARTRTGGATMLNHVITWISMMSLDWIERQQAAGVVFDEEAIARIRAIVHDPSIANEHLPLADIRAFDLPGFPFKLEKIMRPGVGIGPKTYAYDKLTVPTLSAAGWFDPLGTSTIDTFIRACELSDETVRGAHRIVIGPWQHTDQIHARGLGELNFGAGDTIGHHNPSRLAETHLRFFDIHLKDAADELPMVRYFLIGADEWRTADVWPPPGTTERTFLLASGGRANTDGGDGRLVDPGAAQRAESDSYAYDPADPVPTHGGRLISLGRLVAGPLDQARIEARRDVLCYTSAALDDALDVVGRTSVRLFAASSAVDTDFLVRLVDVHPDGRAIPVAEAIQRARYRRGMDEEVLLEPGAVEQYDLDLGHMAWRFQPGHRIRLDVTSSCFPYYDRNMNTGNPVGADAEGVVATQTVMHTDTHPSALTVSTLPAID